MTQALYPNLVAGQEAENETISSVLIEDKIVSTAAYGDFLSFSTVIFYVNYSLELQTYDLGHFINIAVNNVS